VLLPIFGSPYKQEKIRNIIGKKPKKYIAVGRWYKDAQKMAKDWLRKFKNTKIEI
jgi:hypothetical protein